MDVDKAFELAKSSIKEELGEEFADCLPISLSSQIILMLT